MHSVTREQKLALIVGFSLILFVGVLISDHLSSARKASIAKVEAEPVPASPMPMAPIAGERSASGLTPYVSPIVEIHNPSVAAIEPQPSTTLAQGPQSENRPTSPFADDAARPEGSPDHDQLRIASRDSTLYNQVRQAGGDIVRGADGITTIKMPVAAGTSPDPRRETSLPSRSSPSLFTPVGPIENVKTHSVVSGESLYVIAAKYYGNGNVWRELAKFNGMDKSGAVRVGMKIKVPSKETLLGRTVVTNPPSNPSTSIDPGIKLIKPAPKDAGPVKVAPLKTAPGKIELASYTVKRGDTLGDISKRTLGTSKRWQEILELNNIDDEDALTPGAVLKLPAKKS